MTDESERGIRYLSGSSTRVAVLDRVCEGATQPATLVESTGVSRTTVHRTLTDLVDRDWVRRVDGGYAATAAGALAVDAYQNAQTTFRTLERVKPFLARAETAVDELEIEWFRAATLSTATESNPHQPLEWYADRLERVDGDRVRGTSPVISRQILETYVPLVDRGVPTELIIGESTYADVAEQYPDELRTLLSQRHYHLYVTTEVPSLGVTLVDETVFLGAYDDGQFVATVESSDRRLRKWAARRYREWREGARRVVADAIPSSE